MIWSYDAFGVEYATSVRFALLLAAEAAIVGIATKNAVASKVRGRVRRGIVSSFSRVLGHPRHISDFYCRYNRIASNIAIRSNAVNHSSERNRESGHPFDRCHQSRTKRTRTGGLLRLGSTRARLNGLPRLARLGGANHRGTAAIRAERLGTQIQLRRCPVSAQETLNQTLEQVDPAVAGLIEQEFERQSQTICLIPSENDVSAAVLAALGSVLTNKYSESYAHRRYYEGQQVIDELEPLAIERARKLFGVEHANVQPYSGSPANLAVYMAFLEPGDTVMGMALPMGGHLPHGWGVSATGKWFHSVQYGVRRETGRADMDEVRELARKERPKLIFCGGTAIPRTIDFPAFAEVASEIDAILVADIAHIAGLIAGGAHPSPVGHAGVITSTTHKTLRGPRGAMIMC